MIYQFKLHQRNAAPRCLIDDVDTDEEGSWIDGTIRVETAGGVARPYPEDHMLSQKTVRSMTVGDMEKYILAYRGGEMEDSAPVIKSLLLIRERMLRLSLSGNPAAERVLMDLLDTR